MGAVFFSLLLLYRPTLLPSNLQLLGLIRNAGSLGAGLAIITGIIMAWRYGIPLRGNYLFDTKLILVAADGLIAQFVIKKQLNAAIDTNQPGVVRAQLLTWAWLSVLIILAIVAISVVRAKTH